MSAAIGVVGCFLFARSTGMGRHYNRWDLMTRIYTKTGDLGQTALFDGTRVSKADARVGAYGDVDELNAWIGLVRAHRPGSDLDAMLVQIQRDLHAMGARLADPRKKIAARVEKADLD